MGRNHHGGRGGGRGRGHGRGRGGGGRGGHHRGRFHGHRGGRGGRGGRGHGGGPRLPKNSSQFHKESFYERDVGITEYINPHDGFEALLKARFSDFHVNEVALDGRIAKLTDFKMPQEFIAVKIDEPEDTPSTHIPQEKWTEIREMMKNLDDDSLSVDIDCPEDKEVRTSIHRMLKHIYQKRIISNTIEVDGKKFIQLKRLSKNNRADKRNEEWPQNVPIYTHFVMYKEGIDTMSAILGIGAALRINPSSFGYAGVKDKRAKTSQWISCKKLVPRNILERCRHVNNVKLGNITFKEQPLQLGDLQGNQFRLALKEITVDDEVIERNLLHLKEHGYINYYGLQRFGNDRTIPTFSIGAKLLQGRFREACHLILKPKSYDDPLESLTDAKKIYDETQDARMAIRDLKVDHRIETKLLFGLSKCGKNDFVTALESIPKNMRLMYIHSLQSFIWNFVVSKRVREYGLKPVVGDLVYVEDIIEDEDLDGETPKSDGVDGGEEEQEEGAEKKVTEEAAQEEEELKDKTSKVKVLTEDDVGNYTIYDLVLPLPGYNITYPGNALKEYYKELLQGHGLTLDMPAQRVKCYTLAGTYRKIFMKPSALEWQMIRYDNPNAQLIASDFDEMMKRPATQNHPEGELKALVMSFVLPPSSYATVVVREVLKTDTSFHHKMLLVTTAKVEDVPENSMLRDKQKLAEFRKLIEGNLNEEELQALKEEFSEPAAKKKRVDDGDDAQDDDDDDDEGIKIQASLV